MPKRIWEKKLQEVVRQQQRFGWLVRDMKGAVFVQQYCSDINKRVSAALPIRWEPNQELNELDALQKINEVMLNSGSILKEALEVFYAKNNYKIYISWNKLVEEFKEYKNINNSSWEKNYSYFFNEIQSLKK